MNLKNLFHDFPIGIVYQNANGEIINANKAAEEILGLSFDQMQGKKSVDPGWRSIKEDGTNFPGEEHPAMVSLRTGKIVKDVLMGVCHNENDDLVWINIHAVPEFKPDTKKPYQVFTTFTDVTQRIINRKKLIDSEKKYRKLIEDIHLPLAIIQNGIIKYVNNEFLNTSGYSIAEVYDKEFIQFVHPEDRDLVYENYQKRIAGNEIEKRYRSRAILKSGKHIWVDVDASNTSYNHEYAVMVTLNNIDNEVKAANELLRKEHDLRVIMNTTRDIIYAVDHDYKLINANQRFIDTTIKAGGKPIKIGESIMGEEYPDDFLKAWHGYFNRALDGETFTVETELMWRDGELHYVENTLAPGKDENGTIYCAIVSSNDITQKKKSQVLIEESEKKYKVLFENSGSAINVIDKQGCFLHVNKMSATNMGGVPSDFVGKNMLEVLDEKTAKEFIRRNKQLIESGRGETYERTFSLPDGEKTFLVKDVILNDSEGNGIALQSSSIEITELRNLQHQFKNVLDNTSEIIFAIDRNYNLILANEAFSTATIRAGGNEIKIGDPVLSNDYPSEFLIFWKANYEKVFKGESLEVESTLEWDDGTHYLKNYLSPLKDEWGKVTGAVVISNDVTKSTRIFKDLQKKEQELESIISRANLGTWIWNIQSGETIFNEKWAEIAGYTLSEISPVSIETWSNMVHPDDLQISNKQLNSHFNGETQYYECDVRMKHKNGHWIWIKDKGSVETWDAQGKPLTMSGIHLDITDRKNAEISNLETTRKLESFIGNLPGIAFICKNDEYWTMEYMSQETEKITGYAPKELIDNTSKAFSDIIHLEDKDYVEKEIKSVISKNETYEIEYRIVRKDGKTIWVLERGCGTNYDKRYEYIEGIIINISERKNFESNLIKSEAIFRNLFENHDSVKFLIDPDNGKIIDANKKASEFYGWSIPELRNMNIGEINLLPKDQIEENINQVSNKKRNHFEFKHQLKNGTIKNVDVYSTRIEEGDNKYLYSIIFDITDRKYLEDRLKLLSEAIEQSPVAVFITDSDGNISYVNKTFSLLTELDEQEVIGKNPRIFNSGTHDDSFYKDLWQTINKGNIFTATVRNKKKSGEIYPARIIISPIKDSNGLITNFVALQQDLSELLIAKEKTEESNQRYELILQGAAGGIYDWDIVNKKVHLNEGWKAMRGYSGDEITENEEEWSNGIHPEDKKKLFNVLQEHFDKKTEIFEFEYRVKHKSGHYIWIFDRGKAIFNDKGEAVRMAGSEIDITVRKKTENELILSKVEAEKNALELLKAQEITKIGSWYLDIKTNEVSWTEELFKMYGFDPAKPVPPYTEHMKLFTPESWQVLSSSLAKTRETGIPYELELRTVRKDNSNGWMWVRGEVVKDENDNNIGLWGAAQDITKSKQIEEELNNAKEKAEESDRLKSAFLATMNHELRTPLNHVLGFSNMIPDMTDDDSIKEFAGLINESGSNLLNIIEDIFDLAMVEQSEIKIREDAVFIRDIYIELKKQLQEVLSGSNKDDSIRLMFKIDSNIATRQIITDKSKVIQVMSNIIKNAVKYTHNGEISLSLMLAEDNYLSIKVKDTGIGIPKDKQEIIFEFFRQVDDSHTRIHDGVGIGLAISQRIANAMGGTIKIESELDIGSEFTFLFPKTFVDENKINPENENTSFTVPDLSGKRVLIVEDDNIAMGMMVNLLKPSKCKIITAVNGQEALDSIKVNPDIDIILMDLKMPVMNGFEATRVIRKEFSDLPIIALTAYSLQKDKKKALDEGCNDIITKPISKEILFKKLQDFLVE